MTEPSRESPRIFVNANHDAVQLLPFAGGTAAVFSRRSPVKETANEDAALLLSVDPSSGVIAVADGCGGMASGAMASRVAVEALMSAVSVAGGDEVKLRGCIMDGIEAANRQVLQLGIGAATTLAVAEISGEAMRPFHVGDSTILLVGNRGKVKLLTRSHSPVGYAIQAGVISHEESLHHEDLHLVSNVVGDTDTHIEVGSERSMARRDTLLVASDGVFDNLHLDEVVHIIRKGSLAQAARQLATRASERMSSTEGDQPSKPDDLTFVLFRLSGRKKS
jgi:serine/threonine protein phosphatase PrpC